MDKFFKARVLDLANDTSDIEPYHHVHVYTKSI